MLRNTLHISFFLSLSQIRINDFWQNWFFEKEFIAGGNRDNSVYTSLNEDWNGSWLMGRELIPFVANEYKYGK